MRISLWLLLSVMAAQPAMANRDYTVTLAPGDGTVLLLGCKEDFESVQRDYFRRPRPPAVTRDPYRLDFMPLGFYLGDHTTESYRAAAAAMKMDVWEWYAQLLKILKAGGANTIYVQGGGYLEKDGELVAKNFAKFAAARGFKVIIQPNDVYFGGSLYAKWKASRAGAAGLDDFFREYIKPRLEQYLPSYHDDPDIFAWSPIEEVDPENEKYLTPYKKLLRELTPRQLHFQYDNRYRALETKERPYPDLFGYGGYFWWLQEHEGKLSLWTPHHGARWFYDRIKPSAEAVHRNFQRQAICTIQGPAWFQLISAEDGMKHGWKPEKDFVSPTAPQVRWLEQRRLFGYYGMYLPPKNGERLSSWLAICAGYKGVMIWAGVLPGPKSVAELIANPNSAAGDSVMTGIVHTDLTVTPQWQEVTDAWRQIKKLERLILSLAPADSAFATSPDPHLFLNSFTDAKGRRFLVIVNGLIGKWDETNPDWLNSPKTKLAVGSDGNLTNYTALTERRESKFTVNTDEGVFDLRMLKSVR